MKHNYLKIVFGNEDRLESADSFFETPEDVSNLLIQLAANIKQFKSSKDYRSSEKSIFDGIPDFSDTP